MKGIDSVKCTVSVFKFTRNRLHSSCEILLPSFAAMLNAKTCRYQDACHSMMALLHLTPALRHPSASSGTAQGPALRQAQGAVASQARGTALRQAQGPVASEAQGPAITDHCFASSARDHNRWFPTDDIVRCVSSQARYLLQAPIRQSLRSCIASTTEYGGSVCPREAKALADTNESEG